MVDPSSDRIPRAPPYSFTARVSYPYGTITLFGAPSHALPVLRSQLLAGPISLATTLGVSFDFLSYRYLDVSVPCVRFM